MGPSPLPWLVSSAKILEAAGAEVLAMPCVTAHNFIDELRREVSVRILNIVEETQNYLTLNFSEVDCLGLLATTGTLSADVFCQLRSKYTILVPSEVDQRDVMAAIYGPEGVKTCGVTKTAYELLEGVIQRLINRGADVLIAACTEIPLVIRPDRTKIPILDTLLILAKAIVREASGHNTTHKA
jgi:aspartate racemase